MRLLIDTHILLWWLSDAPFLTKAQSVAIQDKRNSCFVSAATVWEINIKRALGKLDIDEHYLMIIHEQGFFELPITWQHASAIQSLPDFHKDPFDRILIAQAQTEGMTLVSSGSHIASYGVPVL